MKSTSKVDRTRSRARDTLLSVRVGKYRYYPMQVTLGDKKRTLRWGDVAFELAQVKDLINKYLDREIKRLDRTVDRRLGRSGRC